MAYLGVAYSNSASGAGNEKLGVALGSAEVLSMEEWPAGRNLGPLGGPRPVRARRAVGPLQVLG